MDARGFRCYERRTRFVARMKTRGRASSPSILASIRFIARGADPFSLSSSSLPSTKIRRRGIRNTARLRPSCWPFYGTGEREDEREETRAETKSAKPTSNSRHADAERSPRPFHACAHPSVCSIRFPFRATSPCRYTPLCLSRFSSHLPTTPPPPLDSLPPPL